MSSSIDSLSRSIAAMRLALTSARPQIKRPDRRPAGHTRRAPDGGTAPGGQGALAALPARIQATAGLEPAARRARALRYFVEAVLVEEFGSNLQLDASFHQLIDRVCRTLEAEGQVQSLLEQAVDELLAV